MSLQTKKCLIITGMHRSNTSYIAKVLQQSGLNIGRDLITGDNFNKGGHFEEKNIVNFHKNIIAKHSLQSFKSVINYTKLKNIDYSKEDRLNASSIIEREFSTVSQFGWKDPRTALFLNFWQQFIPQAKFLFVIRHPDECVASLVRRSTYSNIIKYRPDLYYRNENLWFITNKLINDFAEKNPADCVFIFVPKNVNEQNVQTKLNDILISKWNFELKPLQLKSNYQENLISKSKKIKSSSVKSLRLYSKLLKHDLSTNH